MIYPHKLYIFQICHTYSIDIPMIIWLVVSTPLKNMKVKWNCCSQYMEKYKPCSKPPTSFIYIYVCVYPIYIPTRWGPQDS